MSLDHKKNVKEESQDDITQSAPFGRISHTLCPNSIQESCHSSMYKNKGDDLQSKQNFDASFSNPKLLTKASSSVSANTWLQKMRQTMAII